MRIETFVRRSLMKAPAEEVFRWHAEPGAFEALTPPWEPVEVVAGSPGVGVGDEVRLRVRIGPVAFPWVARVVESVPGRRFRDVQVRGPFTLWEHTHLMEPAGQESSWLIDWVVYTLPLGSLGRLAGSRLVRERLERMFAYRHRVTAQALAERRSVPGRRPTVSKERGAGA